MKKRKSQLLRGEVNTDETDVQEQSQDVTDDSTADTPMTEDVVSSEIRYDLESDDSGRRKRRKPVWMTDYVEY